VDLTLDETLKEYFEGDTHGQTQETVGLYDAILTILKAQPKHPDANHHMGMLAVDVGKVQEALLFFKTALDADSSIGQFWLSYIDALMRLDQLADAKAVFDQAKDKGAKGEAFDQLERQLFDASDKPQDPPPEQLQLIIDVYTQGQLQQVLSDVNQMLERFPNSAVLYNIAGAANVGLMRFDASIACFKQAIKINPNNAEAYNNMGNALRAMGDLDAAIDSFKQALKIKPNNAQVYNNMGVALNDKGDPESAIDCYKKALTIKPDYSEAYNNMGIALNDKGDPESAIDCYKKALTIKPDYAVAYRHFSDLNSYKEHDEHFIKMQSLCMDPSTTDEDRCNLSFSLSKASEDLNEMSQSFNYLKMGNQLRKKILSYNIKHDIELFTQLKKSYPSIAKFALQSTGETGELKPIFILGMPRSGTTLVEQIVSSHSEVAGAGELTYVERFGQSIAKGVIGPNTEIILDFRQRYIEALKKRSDARSIVTDKLPQNFLYIGLIFSAFPDAKVIHVNRDPAATCWSNYKHYFAAKDLGYSYNLDDVVTYFGLYKDLMQFWNTYYGDRIFDLNYDNLTINQEDETRKLIQHLGLEWERGCLSPQSNKRNVRTASQQQVRQKVYQGSSQQWRKFEPYLNGAFDRLTGLS
jgi:tetratricopeptide (TPR) repeat protein